MFYFLFVLSSSYFYFLIFLSVTRCSDDNYPDELSLKDMTGFWGLFSRPDLTDPL